MERAYRQEPLLLSRFLLALALAATAAAAWLHFHSPLCLALRAEAPLQLAYLGRTPALAVYEPGTRRLTVIMGHSFKFTESGPDGRSRELSAALAQSHPPDAVLRHMQAGTDGDGRTLWNEAKELVSSWHAAPLLLRDYLSSYRQAHAGAETDISPYEFAALSLELVKIGPLDLCALKEDTKRKTAGAEEEAPPAPAAAAEPLKIEILNATLRKGQAVALTKYLRELAASGELKVDVLSYDNYGRREKKSRIISRSGRLDELKALGAKLGLEAVEITAAPEQPGQLDASLIAGEDLVLPARR